MLVLSILVVFCSACCSCNKNTGSPASQVGFTILDSSGVHQLIDPAYTEATISSLSVGGKDYFESEKFLFMTQYDTVVTLQIDDAEPVRVAQVIIYFNEENPRVAWQTTVVSDWVMVDLGSIKKVTIVP
jgi:hypothetical protein